MTIVMQAPSEKKKQVNACYNTHIYNHTDIQYNITQQHSCHKSYAPYPTLKRSFIHKQKYLDNIAMTAL